MSFLSALWARVSGEPVLVYTLVAAVLQTAVTFGLNLSVDQVAQLNVLTLAVLSVIVRSKVTPA